jgi:hypothetical protein
MGGVAAAWFATHGVAALHRYARNDVDQEHGHNTALAVITWMRLLSERRYAEAMAIFEGQWSGWGRHEF